MAFDIGKNVSDLKSQMGQILGLGNDAVAASEKDPLPYKSGGLLDRKVQTPDATRWDQVYRYSFQIAKVSKNGSVSVTGNSDIPDGFNRTTVFLRIPPSSISISTPFAMSVVATNRGVLEESNGVVFRSIQLSGTTGMFPDRAVVGGNATPATGVLGLVKSIFPGATTAISGVLKQVNALKSAVVGDDTPKDLSPNPESQYELQQTGYYQFWLLHNFFVAYAEMKKRKLKSGNASEWRLVFNSPKDNIAYVCTPVSFDLRKDRSEPNLYRYSITLKAWDLAIDATSDKGVDALAGIPTPENVGAIKSITEVLRQTRKTIQSVSNVFQGVYSDINSIFNVYNQGMLVLKDAVGVAEEIADFPNQIKNSADLLLRGPQNDFVAALKTFQTTSDSRTGVLNFDSADEQTSPFPGMNQQTSITGASGSPAQTTTSPSGETTPPPQSSFLTQAVGAFQQAVDDPEFAGQPLDNFQIPEQVQNSIDDARDEALNTSSSDIRDLVAGLQSMSNNFGEAIGAGDADYNLAYNLPPPIEVDRNPSEDDIINQAALQEAALNWISTLATGQIFQERESDPFVFANGYLGDNDQVPSPISAIPVVFQRGQSLESMAQQFLGDANRAREIAILNNLRPPFIDEEHFTRAIFNANGRAFVVKSDDNLAINQVITIKGSTVARTRRRIINLEDIGGGQFRVTVDGADNLSMYGIATTPFLEARVPGTVGSGDILLIPSEASPDDPLSVRPNAIQDRLTHAEKVFKIDIALDDKGRDIVVSPTGDVKRAYGYDNALQALRIAVETERGELEQHKDFGLAVGIGSRNSDVTQEQVREAVTTTILNDPRFADAITGVEINGSISKIKINAFGAGGTGQVPVEFEVGKT